MMGLFAMLGLKTNALKFFNLFRTSKIPHIRVPKTTSSQVNGDQQQPRPRASSFIKYVILNGHRMGHFFFSSVWASTIG